MDKRKKDADLSEAQIQEAFVMLGLPDKETRDSFLVFEKQKPEKSETQESCAGASSATPCFGEGN